MPGATAPGEDANAAGSGRPPPVRRVAFTERPGAATTDGMIEIVLPGPGDGDAPLWICQPVAGEQEVSRAKKATFPGEMMG